MTCISSAWCPQCEQIVSDTICMCACVCDRHGQVCTPVIPDGLHDVRQIGNSTPHTKREFRNGWEIGFYGWPPGRDFRKLPSVWITKEPGHPTKTPYEVEQDYQDKQAIVYAERRRVQEIERNDQLNCNGGGSI